MLFAVILAGGKGVRLGRPNKALAPLGGTTLIAHVIGRLRPQVDRIVVACRSDPEAYAPMETIADLPASASLPGVFRGLHAALTLAASMGRETDAVLTVPADTPFLPRGLASALRPGPSGVAIARDARRMHATIACWTRAASAGGLAALDRYADESVVDFARSLEASVVEVPLAADESFLNVNTPDDLRAAEDFLRRRCGHPAA